VCELSSPTGDPTEQNEGKPEWFSMEEIELNKNEIIPSDYLMLTHLFPDPKKHYWESEMEKKNGVFTVQKFS